MNFTCNLNLIVLLLDTLLVSSVGSFTFMSLVNGAVETPASDISTGRKRIHNNDTLASFIDDQPLSKDRNGSPSRPIGKAKIKPKFVIEPRNKSAIIGDTVLLPCRVLNRVSPLQWIQDGFGLGPDRKLERYPDEMIGSDEEGDFSLQIKNVSLEDEATYQCQVQAGDGIAGIRSRDATLNVFVPPEPPKIVQGDILRAIAGVTVELTCESYGGKPAVELTWIDGDGNAVTNGINQINQFLSDNKRTNSSLKWTFILVREHHGKKFTCRAQNPALNQPQEAFIWVKVKHKPKIQLKSDKTHYMEGDDVRLSCRALAVPSNIIFEWQRNFNGKFNFNVF